MSFTRRFALGVLLLIAVVVAPLSAQVAINDVFDRAPSTVLGQDWTEIDGDAVIAGNQLQGNSPFTFGWAAHTAYGHGYLDTVVRADWSMNGFGGDRISIIAGVDPATWQGIEIRIADNNGDGLADRIFFNAAVNAGNWYTGSTFFNLVNPIVSGTATLWFTFGGDTANIEIRGPSSTEVFSASGILTNPPTGTAVGVGYFGDATLDDFRAWTGVPSGPCYTLTPPRVGSGGAFLLTDAAHNGTALLAFSLTGTGPLPTGIGNVLLSEPIFLLAILPTDANGRAELPVPPLPGTLFGVTLYHQALDAVAPALSNGFTTTVL